MSESATSSGNNKSPLDAAQKIVAELQGMTKENQTLAMKFAIETLGLQIQTAQMHMTAAQVQPSITPPHNMSVTRGSNDIKSFTALKAPKSDQQFAAVVAYFYQFEAPSNQRKDSIDAATMKDAARLVVWGQ